ncbi:MAG TPA: hypothetical protein VLV86_25550 [Vicinamibacterales bacterium]|nr:hypothetical protein [Vicinamibacterales bacterium]
MRKLFLVATSSALLWCVAHAAPVHKGLTPADRLDAIRRAQVWRPTDIPSLDLKTGPGGAGSFAPGTTVPCDFAPHDRGSGHTPKFWCAVAPGDVVKVRYREHNGKLYGLVAATRLFWALGFGADRAYPVTVACRGCALDPWKKGSSPAPQGSVSFDPATIDRRMPGRRLDAKPREGWAWPELDRVDEAAGGATVAQRDALKLLAVLVQHTDSKPENQALICLDTPLRLTEPLDDTDEDTGARCDHPFMMVPDLGNTFGHANRFNRDASSSVNFRDWQETPIWRGREKGSCVGNLSKSSTGSLDNPRISEAGRRFLAKLLVQLSDAQLHDMFDVARFTRRDPSRTVEDWVGVFKQKRDEIVNATCAQ